MGAWGHGNLENDGAMDFVSEFSEELFNRVFELLKHPNGHEYDNGEIDELFVRIEMILALHKKGLISASRDRGELHTLFDPYLARWEAYYQGNAPAKRRRVMERTFRRLSKVVKKLHNSYGGFVEVPFDPNDEKNKMIMNIFDSVDRLHAEQYDQEKASNKMDEATPRKPSD